jgi:hypothetical protein
VLDNPQDTLVHDYSQHFSVAIETQDNPSIVQTTMTNQQATLTQQYPSHEVPIPPAHGISIVNPTNDDQTTGLNLCTVDRYESDSPPLIEFTAGEIYVVSPSLQLVKQHPAVGDCFKYNGLTLDKIPEPQTSASAHQFKKIPCVGHFKFNFLIEPISDD